MFLSSLLSHLIVDALNGLRHYQTGFGESWRAPLRQLKKSLRALKNHRIWMWTYDRTFITHDTFYGFFRSIHIFFEIYLLENTQHIFFIYCRMKILAFEFSSFNFAFCRCHIVAAVRSMLQRTSEALLIYAFNTCEFSSFSESGNISAVAPTMPIYPQPTPTH